MKPKQNQAGDINESNVFDRCQTPFYALDPLIPYLPKHELIWEPAQGDGHIVAKLTDEKFMILGTDILTGCNFFDYELEGFGCQVTNPPYSIKYDWLRRSYELEKPFALLLPLETLGSSKGQALFEQYGIEIILLDKRVNFKMPHKGYGKSGAQFPVAWFTWRLGIGQQITYGKITRYEDDQIPLFDYTSQPKAKPKQLQLV
jgi:hypothetical protein